MTTEKFRHSFTTLTTLKDERETVFGGSFELNTLLSRLKLLFVSYFFFVICLFLLLISNFFYYYSMRDEPFCESCFLFFVIGHLIFKESSKCDNFSQKVFVKKKSILPFFALESKRLEIFKEMYCLMME